jgi:hypothetical protein
MAYVLRPLGQSGFPVTGSKETDAPFAVVKVARFIARLSGNQPLSNGCFARFSRCRVAVV